MYEYVRNVHLQPINMARYIFPIILLLILRSNKNFEKMHWGKCINGGQLFTYR